MTRLAVVLGVLIGLVVGWRLGAPRALPASRAPVDAPLPPRDDLARRDKASAENDKLRREIADLRAAAVKAADPVEQALAAVDWDRLARTTLAQELAITVDGADEEFAWEQMRKLAEDLKAAFGTREFAMALALSRLLLARNRLQGDDPTIRAAVEAAAAPLREQIRNETERPGELVIERDLRGLELQAAFLRDVANRLPLLPLPGVFSVVDMAQPRGRSADEPAWVEATSTHWKQLLGIGDREFEKAMPAVARFARDRVLLETSGARGPARGIELMRQRVALHKAMLESVATTEEQVKRVRGHKSLHVYLDMVVTTYRVGPWSER